MSTKRRSLNRGLRDILNETVDVLTRALGEEIRSVILFGSYARGSATVDSDIDLLVIVRSASKSVDETVSQVTYDVMWRHDFQHLLSTLVIDQARYDSLVADRFSLAQNVEREGIVLWPKAA